MTIRVFMFNDTSRSRHAGCKAVMRSLYSTINELSILEICGTHYVGARAVDNESFSNADLVFVNGEGSIHHDSPRSNHLLDWIARAKSENKTVFLVNSLFQQFTYHDDKILDGLTWLSVREPKSAAFARRYGGTPNILLDSAADPRFIGRGQAIDFSAPVLVGGAHPNSPWPDPFSEIEGSTVLSLADHSYEDIVATLERADLYLTGQHHGVYAAGLAACPFVATPSNSHKIEGFIEWTGLPLPIVYQPKELNGAMAYARRNVGMFEELRSFLCQQRVFDPDLLRMALSLSGKPK